MSRDPHEDRSVTEVELLIQDESYPFVSATAKWDCIFELVEMMPRTRGYYAEFFNVTGISPESVVEVAEDHDGLRVSLLEEYDNGGLFEFTNRGNCPAFALAELGALPRKATSADGEGHLVAEIPPQYDAASIVDEFLESHSDVGLLAKREKESISSNITEAAAGHIMDSALTDRQEEILELAFERGYYAWPRRCSSQALAEELDISSATFAEHIRAAERKIITEILADRPGRLERD